MKMEEVNKFESFADIICTWPLSVSHGLFSCHCEDHTNEEEEREEKGTAFFGLFGDCGASVYLSRCYDDDDAPV